MEAKPIKIVKKQVSAFKNEDIDKVVDLLEKQIQQLYLSDVIPWVVGYSGGKDSTATLQLVWNAIKKLPKEKRGKDIFVISTDTLVENPVVAMWVTASLEKMAKQAKEQEMPIFPNRLTPETNNSFWVNLIGRGYPAPRPKFRWCTERLKINPANKFVLNIVNQNGEAIMVLGTRKAESAKRKQTMENYEGSTRDLLSRNSNPQFERVWIYSPIADWINDDVWEYLFTYDNPWGYDNSQLMDMYRAGSEDNECPLVVDTTTPSCGDSRFGCFVCTLVDKDKSMEAMINNDEEKKWMTPLSEFRNKYLDTNDHMHREFKRRNGALMLMNDKFTGKKKLIPGPYKQSYRKKLLSEVLKAQEVVRKSGVKGVDDFILINEDELQAIRKIWVEERNEIEDEVPRIYEEFTGKNYPFPELSENQIFNFEDLQLLNKEASQNGSLDDIHYQLTRNLISIEKKYSSSTRRTGIYDEIESALVKGAFETPDEALLFAKNKYEVNGKTDEIQPNERDSSGLFEVVEKVEDESELGD